MADKQIPGVELDGMTIIEKIKEIDEKLNKLRFVDNDIVKWDDHGDGMEAKVIIPAVTGGGGGNAMFPAKIVSKDGPFYNVTKYEDGIDSTSTGEARVYVLQLALADTLPADTWIMTSLSAIGTTGGGNVL